MEKKYSNISLNNLKVLCLTYEDFIIENYYPEPPIKYQLNVGL